MNSTLTQQRAERTHTTESDRLPMLDLLGIAALGAVIAIHTSELSGKVDETAYLGFGYVLLIAASIISDRADLRRDVRGWILGGLDCGGDVRRLCTHPHHGSPARPR